MKKRKSVALAAVICAAMTFGGCSFSGMMEKAVDLITDTATKEETEVVIKHSVEAKDVDKSLAAPVFNTDIAGATIGQIGIPVTLDGTATAGDGGMLTYQWYRNTVDSNGGGTAIDGATEPVYTPDTTTVGSSFYYVVAVNNHGEKVNMAASSTHEVEIWGEGRWQQNPELGAYQYVMVDDERFPAELSMEIDGVSYTFNEDGYAVDADGNYLDVMTGQPILEEEAVEATPEPTPEPEQPAEGGETGAEEGTNTEENAEGGNAGEENTAEENTGEAMEAESTGETAE